MFNKCYLGLVAVSQDQPISHYSVIQLQVEVAVSYLQLVRACQHHSFEAARAIVTFGTGCCYPGPSHIILTVCAIIYVQLPVSNCQLVNFKIALHRATSYIMPTLNKHQI